MILLKMLLVYCFLLGVILTILIMELQYVGPKVELDLLKEICGLLSLSFIYLQLSLPSCKLGGRISSYLWALSGFRTSQVEVYSSLSLKLYPMIVWVFRFV